jgi:predicted nucleotidyltransferase
LKTSDKQILSQIKKAVLDVDADAELILFGSRARGDYRKSSDWDLLVLTDKTVDWSVKKILRKPLFKIEEENKIDLNTTIVNKKNWSNKFSNHPLFYEIKKEGIML